MTRRILAPVAASVLLACASLASAQDFAVDYQVIVHASNPTRSLSPDQLRDIFLKKMTKWDSGQPVVPVDQVASSKVRAVFTRVVHGKPVSAMASHWQQQIFSGRGVPPVEKPGDAEVIAFVRADLGAIGYVTGGVSAPGTRPLTIR